MWRSGSSARLERHLDRGEELMELNRIALDRNKEAFDRNKEAFDANKEAFDRMMAALDRHEETVEGNILFIREMNLRNEKVVQQIVRDHEDFMAELKVRGEQSERRTDAIIARLEEVTKEQKAQRQALLRVIDRLPPPAEAA